MIKIEIKHPDKQETSRMPYSAGVLCDGWLYVSGQGPVDLNTMAIQGETIEEQTRLALQNVEKILRAGGCELSDVVKCTCYIANMADFDRFSRTYREFFSGVRPARSTMQSILWGGMLVEIDAIAKVPDQSE